MTPDKVTHKQPALAAMHCTPQQGDLFSVVQHNQKVNKHPTVGLQRPQDKPPGKPKEKPKAKHVNALHGDNAKKQPENPDAEDDWQRMITKHLTRSDTHRKDIERIMPKLDAIVKQQMKSTTERIPQWQITKFRSLQEHITNADQAQFKLKETHAQMKNIAKLIGHPEPFDINKEFTPKKKPTRQQNSPTATQFIPESLTDEFHKNQRETTEFDLDSGPEAEDDNMPKLYYNNEDSSTDIETTTKTKKVFDPKEDIELKSADEENSEDTDGAHFIIRSEKMQNPRNEATTEATTTAKETLDDTTRLIEEQREKVERLLDKEAEEIDVIHPHTPTVHHNESYDNGEFELLPARAIQNQWNKKHAEMEETWQTKKKEFGPPGARSGRPWRHNAGKPSRNKR